MPVRASISLTRLGQAHAGAALAVGAVVALSACGVSRSHANNAQTATRRSSTDIVASHSGGTGSGDPRERCETVADPKPKGPQHIAKPKTALDPSKTYIVRLETNCGLIAIKLAVKTAPRIAASFAYLVQRGFYDDLTFHLVIAGFLIQGGDPQGDGSGGPGYEVIEKPAANTGYTAGTVAMAKTATDPAGAAGSQFFIVVGKKDDLPPQYAILGKVIRGWNTVTAISRVPTERDGESDSPESPIVISRAILIDN